MNLIILGLGKLSLETKQMEFFFLNLCIYFPCNFSGSVILFVLTDYPTTNEVLNTSHTVSIHFIQFHLYIQKHIWHHNLVYIYCWLIHSMHVFATIFNEYTEYVTNTLICFLDFQIEVIVGSHCLWSSLLFIFCELFYQIVQLYF
jgi:hypothetical protein